MFVLGIVDTTLPKRVGFYPQNAGDNLLPQSNAQRYGA